MALEFEDILGEAGVPGGLVLGVGALLLAPVLAPVMTGVLRPLAKSAIKNGIIAYERGRGLVAEIGETFEDVIAEARAEIAEERTTDRGPTTVNVE